MKYYIFILTIFMSFSVFAESEISELLEMYDNSVKQNREALIDNLDDPEFSEEEIAQTIEEYDAMTAEGRANLLSMSEDEVAAFKKEYEPSKDDCLFTPKFMYLFTRQELGKRSSRSTGQKVFSYLKMPFTFAADTLMLVATIPMGFNDHCRPID